MNYECFSVASMRLPYSTYTLLAFLNNQFQDYLKNPNEHSLFLRETTPDEVARVLKKLKKLVICMADHLNLSTYQLM